MPSEAIGHSGGGNIICSRRRRDQCAAPHDHHRRIEQSVPPAAAAQLQLPADPRPQQCNLIAHAVRRMRGARAPRRGAGGGGTAIANGWGIDLKYGRVQVQFTRYSRYFSFTRQAYLYT